jgi:hypothetical protein
MPMLCSGVLFRWRGVIIVFYYRTATTINAPPLIVGRERGFGDLTLLLPPLQMDFTLNLR